MNVKNGLQISALALISALAAGNALGAPSCGTDPVALNSYFETGFPLPTELSKEFTKQFPNVTFSIKEDMFATLMENSPRVLSGDNPPDLIRLDETHGLPALADAEIALMRAPAAQPRAAEALRRFILSSLDHAHAAV